MFSVVEKETTFIHSKPFLKWAGGKTQLINTINQYLPIATKNGQPFTYIEPFVGSGAVLFWMLATLPNIKKAVINDINDELINTYRVIALNPKALISVLKEIQDEYHFIDNEPEKKQEYFYNKRELFNSRQSDRITQAALFIYLNRACFNGLYRVNRSNNFNVPIGSYKKPTICDKNNLLAVSEALQKVEILSGDYENTLQYADHNSFFYFDPPYKPLSQTSSFNSYAKDEFGDDEQIRLKNFCDKIDHLDYKWMLSNSDVKGKDTANNFFDDLYSDYKIHRVTARRIINANSEKRGQLSELLIINYKNDKILHL